jgi:hypothetical protein
VGAAARLAASLLIAFGVLAGCAPGVNDELRALIEEVELETASSSDCEWGSSSYENDPESWYGCWDYAPGSLSSVSESLRKRLTARGFRVSGRVRQARIELTGVRGTHAVCVDVLARGFVRGRNTRAEEVEISPGEVFVDIWTTEPRPSSARPRCAELPPWPDE